MIERFLETLNTRLDKGSREYGNRSFNRPVAESEREFEEELIDLVGWVYVMWTQAAQKADVKGDEQQLRTMFFENLRHRLIRNDRRSPEHEPAAGAYSCMCDLEILAMDLFHHAQHIKQRLSPIARAIEVARWMTSIKGRRGGACDPRTSD